MSGSVTTTYRFKLIDLGDDSWHDVVNDNMWLAEAVLAKYIGAFNVQGVWANSTSYTTGQVVVDNTTGALYECAVGHTSAASPTTFSSDRTTNPTYWDLASVPIRWRGTWASSTSYSIGDIIIETAGDGIAYVANVSHTSGGTFAGDSANWDTAIDLSASVTAAATSASNASTSATNAATSATTASTAATTAETALTKIGISYNFDTGTAGAGISSGDIRLNNATASSVTEIYLHDTDANSVDVSALVATFDDSTSSNKGTFFIRTAADATEFAAFTVSSITDNTSYYTLTVTHIVGSGGWSDNDVLRTEFVRTGDKGDTGNVNLDINGLTAETTPAASDAVAVYDASAAANRKITHANWLSVLTGAVNGQDNEVSRVTLKDYAEEVDTESTSGASYTIDIVNGNVHDVTLTANCTLTFSNPIASGDCTSFTLIARQDGTGSRTITWPASVDWAGATAPTLSTGASDVDVMTFMTVDGGTTWLGFVAGQDMS